MFNVGTLVYHEVDIRHRRLDLGIVLAARGTHGILVQFERDGQIVVRTSSLSPLFTQLEIFNV